MVYSVFDWSDCFYVYRYVKLIQKKCYLNVTIQNTYALDNIDTQINEYETLKIITIGRYCTEIAFY